MKKFCKEFEVHYYEVNRHLEAVPVSILNYLEDTAIAHSESVGMGVDRLRSDGVGWVLNRWSLDLEENPKWGERLSVQTWPSRFDKFFAEREFNIINAQNRVIGRVRTLWIFINIEKKRPARIPDEVGQAYGINPEKSIDKEFHQFEGMVKPEIIKEFSVRQSDIDSNNHVNNTRFVEWIIESIPEYVYEKFCLRGLEVIYKKEVTYGTTIFSSSTMLESSYEERAFLHSINGSDGTELALAKTVWQKR